MGFYELKNITTEQEQPIYETTETLSPNGTLIYEGKIIGYNIITNSELKWKPCKTRLLTKNEGEFKESYETINIPKLYSKEKDATVNGTKHFRIEFKTPMIQLSGGWGSKGTIALQLNNDVFDPSWLSDWDYRKSHIINQTADAGTNYQMNVTTYYGSGSDSGSNVYLNTNSQIDFDDVRFTDSTSNLLYQWRQEVTFSSNAVFWFNITDNISSGDVTIYVYYGNDGASLYSDFDNTFIFGEPFDNATLDTSRWTTVDPNPTYSISTANNELTVTNINGYNWGTGKGFHSREIVFPTQFILEDAYSLDGMRHSFDHAGSNNIWMSSITINNDATHATNTRDTGMWFRDAWSGSVDTMCAFFFENSEDYTNLRSGNQDSDIRLIKDDGDYRSYEDANLRIDDTVTPNAISRLHLGLGRYQNYAFGTTIFGAFKIRKYVTPEPVHGSWGVESQSGYYVTTYNQSNSVFMINGTRRINGTAYFYTNLSVIELQGIINVSTQFIEWNITTGNIQVNPYNHTVTQNITIWLMVNAVSGGNGNGDGETLFLSNQVNAIPLNLLFYMLITIIGLALLFKSKFIGKLLACPIFAFIAMWTSNDVLLDTTIQYITSYNATTGVYQYANTVTHINTPMLSLLIILNIGFSFISAIDFFLIRQKRKD